MSVIKFPNNRNFYIDQADRFLKENNRALELENLLRAYELGKDFKINYRIVDSYYRSDQFEKALSFLNDYEDDYFKLYETQKLYFNILIACDQFEEADELLRTKLVENPDIDKLKRELDTAIDMALKDKGLEPDKLLKDLYNIGSLEQENQLFVCSMAGLIPLEKLEPVSQSVLNNPYVSHFIKTPLLCSLIEAGSTKIFNYSIVDQTYKIKINELTNFEADPFREDIYRLLDEILDDRPADKIMTQDEITYHLSILYPLYHQFIQEKVEWINYYIDYYLNIKRPNVKNKEMYNWFQLLIREDIQ